MYPIYIFSTLPPKSKLAYTFLTVSSQSLKGNGEMDGVEEQMALDFFFLLFLALLLLSFTAHDPYLIFFPMMRSSK